MAPRKVPVCRLLIAMSFLLAVPTRAAQEVATNSLVIVSGVRPTEAWRQAEHVRFSDGDYFIASGTVALALREVSGKPVEVTLWGRGDLGFFNPEELSLRQDHAWPARHEWPAMRVRLEKGGHLRPLARATVASPHQRTHVGYLLRVPRHVVGEGTARIFVAAAGAAPQEVIVDFEVKPGPLEGLQTTLLVGGLSTVLGALVGLATFHWQRRVTREEDRSKAFEERKIGASAKLWKFFQDDYRSLLTDATRTDLQRVNDVRTTMIQDEVLSVLLPETAVEIARICDSGTAVQGNRTDALEKVLRRHFSEYMRVQRT